MECGDETERKGREIHKIQGNMQYNRDNKNNAYLYGDSGNGIIHSDWLGRGVIEKRKEKKKT